MDLLEHFYENPPQNDIFFSRALAMPSHPCVNLYGPRGCGKTAWLLEWMRRNDEPTLYVDLESPSLIVTPLESLPLQDFIDAYGIKTLILDHYEEGLMDSFPNVPRMIVASRVASALPDTTSLAFDPLSFEEFCALHPGTPANAFNRYVRTGTLPGTSLQSKSAQLVFKRFFQHQFTPNEQSVLLTLARLHTQPLTTHQIYTFTREHFKISKDTVYAVIKRFEQEGIVTFLPNRQKRTGKKAIFYDFAFAKYLTVAQPFGVLFESMTLLALLRRGYLPETLGLHEFVVDGSRLVLPSPFESEEQAWLKAQKRFSAYRDEGITRVDIVTVSTKYRFEIGDIDFKGVPFYDWSLQS